MMSDRSSRADDVIRIYIDVSGCPHNVQLDPLPVIVLAGIHHTAAKELAEAGCSDTKIQSVTSHRSLQMVQKYREQARQKRLSKAAQSRRARNKNKT